MYQNGVETPKTAREKRGAREEERIVSYLISCKLDCCISSQWTDAPMRKAAEVAKIPKTKI